MGQRLIPFQKRESFSTLSFFFKKNKLRHSKRVNSLTLLIFDFVWHTPSKMASAFSARTNSRPSFLTSVLPLSSLREQSSPSGKASNSSLRRLKQVGTTWSSPTCLRLFLTESLKRLPYRQASFCGVLLKRTTASPLKGGLPFRMKSWRPSTLPILARVSGTSSRAGQSLSRNLSLPKTVHSAKPLKSICNTAYSTTLNKKGLRTLFIFRLSN